MFSFIKLNFPPPKLVREWHFTFLQITLMFELTENGWILLPAFTLTMLPYVVLAEVYEEGLASHVYGVEKGGLFLIVLSDNCGYSSLIPL